MDNFSLRGLFSRNKAPRERRRRLRNRPTTGTTILIVDDSRIVQHSLRVMLHQAGYQTLEARDAETGIQLARAHRPDLIFMDVVMPGLNGFQATRKLRQDPDTRDIPIIIISGNEQATEKFWVIRIGANDFMTKPFERATVFQKIEPLLPAT
jgi:twitching motility two-component system response regulator PilH